MTSGTVTVIRSQGDSTYTEEIPVSSSEFFVKVDGDLYTPEVVTEVEIEKDDGSEVVSDQCGNTKRRSLTDRGWRVRVKGIVTMNDGRSGNLSLQLLRDTVASMDTVTVGSDIISGEIIVQNVLITQTSDLVSIDTRSTDGEERAVEFQLQLGEEEASNE